MTKLDSREARPLTSREIAKILCGVIGGIIAAGDAHPTTIYGVLAATREYMEAMQHEPGWKIPLQAPALASAFTSGWPSALGGAIGSFDGWCSRQQVITACDWILEHWSEIGGIMKPAGQG